ncbi:hypothetical protein TNCV_185761 [Trichonephila clavipes]|nr:hypothetical protein TNCV_185761 [Trichonephila clavipes]
MSPVDTVTCCVPGNEEGDELAGRGWDLSSPSSSVLSPSEIHSVHRTQINLTWRNPPAHHWSNGLGEDFPAPRGLETTPTTE